MASRGFTLGIAAAAIIALGVTANAQALMSLEEASRRQPPSFAPAHAGAQATLQGTVSSGPVRIRDYSHAVIQDDKNFGFTLEWTGDAPRSIIAGEVIRATGTVAHRAGLVVLRVESFEIIGSAPAPEPAKLHAADLNGFRHQGKYVEFEAVVLSSRQTAAGDVLLVGERHSNVAIFLPRAAPGPAEGLREFLPGDKILARGISSQYCPVDPYDRGFQIVVGDAESVKLLNRGWVVPADVLMYGGAALIAILGIWWIRERQAASQRRVMRRMMALSEELLTAPTAVELARNLETTLPPLLGPSTIYLYVFNRGAKALERVNTDTSLDRYAIDVDEPMGTLAAASALCFRNRALLEIPNTRKSPLVSSIVETGDPQGALFVPLFAQSEPVGVIAVHYNRPVNRLSSDQRTAMQHLGNLIAASLRLQEQRWMRDQLLRSEKMAAAGQLISGVANDLREPFSTITDGVRDALQSGSPARSTLLKIDHAARHGLEIVQHLLAFSRMERSEPRPLDLFGLVSSIVEMRQVECAAKGVRLETSLPISALQVVGDQAQLEQVFLSLLLYAEQTAAATESKAVSVVGRPIGKRVLISISHSGNSLENSQNAFDARVYHALIQGHAGELRVSRDGDLNRFEVDLPLYQPTTIGFEESAYPTRKASRKLTALLIEPDAVLQRKIVSFLSGREHRAIPVESYEAALEAVQRFRFDMVLCADRVSGNTWVDFFQRVRRKIGCFVLITDIEQVEAGPAFKSGEAFVLRKPVDDSELDNLLKLVETNEPARR
jgi:signal transduction histidine kinase/CheY-like chemotaxis protein